MGVLRSFRSKITRTADRGRARPTDPPDELMFDRVDGYASFDDTDTAAEVFAVWRVQRRIALGYMAIFLVGTLGVGVAIDTLPWITDTAVLGGFSPGFVLAAFGLYAFFVIVGTAAASIADSVERRMMGASSVEERRMMGEATAEERRPR